MNRREFFAGLALVPAMPVAAATAATSDAKGDVIDFDNLHQFSGGEARAFVMRHKGNPTLRVAKPLAEYVGADGFVRRKATSGFICLDGKVVGMIAFEPGYFSEVDVHAAVTTGRISVDTARKLRALRA